MTKGQQEFTVVPDSIIFRDSKPGEMDSIDVWVTNVGSKPIQIRFKLQTDSKFNISVENTQFTPPGLGIKAVLKYKCTEQQVIREELTIYTPTYTTKVPIMALPPCPRIVCDLPSLSIGSVGVDTKSKFTFSISNIGTREGTFNVTCDDDTVEFIPSTGPLLPNKTCEIAGTIKPQNIGDFSLKINVHTQEHDLDPAVLTVTGTAVQHSLSLMLDDKEVSVIDFQTIFIGQKRVCDAKIVNQGQYKRSFVVMPARNTPTQKSRLDVTNNYLTQSRNQIFSAIPSEGTLNPYQSTTIRFVFNPPTDTPQVLENEQEYKYYSSIEIVETSQHIDFQFQGKTAPLSVSLSTTDFQFETTAVMSRTNQQLILKNNSILPTNYNVKPIAHFRFEPSKGVINPNSSKTINVIFFPKTLGDFSISTPIIFSDGLIRKTLNLIGRSTKSGVEHKPFKREDPWLENEDIKFRAMHPDPKYSYGIKELEKRKEAREVYDKYLSEPRKKREQMQIERERKRKIVEKAKSYLENTRGEYTQDELNEYLTHTVSLEDMMEDMDDNGLMPPDPPLHIIETPLKSSENSSNVLAKENLDQSNNNQQKTLLNNNENLIKKKFKAKATTPAEINECSHPLTPAQQLLVTASHETMNFGQVSVYSSVARSFTITNNLQQNIIVSINYEYDELSKSGPVSQVIPPKQVAGFDIRFFSSKPQNFMKTITYTVNNAHSYSVNIGAQVIPIDVQLSKTSMEFRFAGDSTVPVIREFITVINRSMAPASYKWADIKPPFSISNPSGTIDPNSSSNIEISYSPGNHPHDELNITLNVSGGPSRTLRLIGDVGSPKCSINKRSLAFGLMPIGILKTQQIRLKNSGDDDAIFSINTNGSRELSISPMSGKVSARDQQMIQISFKANHARVFDLPVTISICGAQPITFNVTAQSELPNVCITNTEFDFGRVFVGSYQSIEGTIKNVGAIPAILFLDLSAHPEFRIEYQTDLSDNNENKNSISLVSDPFFVTKMVPAQEYMSMESSTSLAFSAHISSSSSTTSLRTDILADFDSSNAGLVYKIQIMDNSQIKFNLVFQPTKQGDHSFELPITLLNMMSSSSFHLQPIVSGEAVLSPIIVSNTSLDFGICPVIDKLNPSQRKVARSISLLNDSKTKISWRFDTSVIPKVNDEPAFTVEPFEGELDSGFTEVIHVQFQPPSATPFNCYVPLLSKGKEESVIGKIQFTGVGTSSMFSVSVPEISLPIVPLNTKSQIELYIKNDGYIDGLLKATLSADENAFPVKVTFPDGNQLQHTQEKLPLLVTFQASKPMSFSVNVALTDDNGHATSFIVTCTTDNSIFTLYPYFANPIQLTAKSTVEDLTNFLNHSELTSRFISSSGDYANIKGQSWEPLCSQMMIKFVMRYFNALFFSTQLSEFPQGLVENQGAVIQEMIQNFMPSKKNDKSEERLSTAVDDKFSKRLDAIKKLLTSLKSMGALLGSVKPEFLLPRQDFVQVMRSKIMKQLLGIDKFGAPELESIDPKVLSEFTSSNAFSSSLVDKLKVIETLYNNLSIESWMIVLMQCFKLYGINRINPEKFNNIPGVQVAVKSLRGNKPQSEDLSDTILKKMREIQYNSKEVSILRWLSLYSVLKSNDSRAIQTDFKSLKDGYAFCCALSYHTKLFNGSIAFLPNDKREREQNAIEFTNALKSLKLGFSPSAEEIFGGNECMNAMIGAYIMDIIPHFIPLQTIEFSGPLHKPITRVVSVTNPSKSEITYRAIYDGSANYQLPSESVFVGPNQTVDFPVTFQARTIKPLSGRLTLIPSRPRYITNSDNSSRSASHPPTYSAPIVVDFISNITVSAPETSVTAETPIYQNLPLKIPVKNLIGVPSKMNIYSLVTLIADENGKEIGSPKSLVQQISAFVQNPLDNNDEFFDYSKEKNIDNIIKNHKTFILNKNNVEFTANKNDFVLELDFVPIKLGTYRCLVLFIDDQKGEFIIEVIGNARLPPGVEITGKFKVEATKKIQASIPIDLINQNLFNALAFSIERFIAILNGNKDGRIKDEVNRRQHDLENISRSTFTTRKFSVLSSSPQFYEMMNELNISKGNPMQTERSNNSKNQQNASNALPITFKPTKAGEYPCKVVLLSDNDVRVFLIKGVALQMTHELSMEFSTTTGKTVKQEIPFTNTSNEVWSFKTTITGDNGFQTTPRFSVKGGATQTIQIQFNPNKVGAFNADLLVQNLTKESSVLYKLTAIVDEPPAEDKIVINAQARIPLKHKISVPKFTLNPIKVTSDIPVINFEKTFTPQPQQSTEFEFEINAQRSGISAGMITFTDSVTQNHIWYVVEIHVSAPAVEQQLNVSTVARQSVSVQIPISNPNKFPVTFNVSYQDTDISGIQEFVVPPQGSINYSVTITPLRSCNKIASIYFYSESGGEFWYNIQITATDPPPSVLAPLSAPIGKFDSTFIAIDNPTDKTVNFRLENEFPNVFDVICKRMILLQPSEKKRIEVRYIPSKIGTKEQSTISFISAEIGTFSYIVSGVGKPPQPLSPTIISSVVSATNSALILFANPFSFPSRFSVTMTTTSEAFSFLVKKKVFTLNTFGEEFQIPFTFSPKELGQFQASIIIVSLGPARSQLPDLDSAPGIRWVYPIIGNSLASDANEAKILKTRSMEPIEQNITFTLVGESESLEPNEYEIRTEVPQNADFIGGQLSMNIIEARHNETGTDLIVNAKFSPMRPVVTTVMSTIKNTLGQEWQFRIDLISEIGRPIETITIESLLNKVGIAHVKMPPEVHGQKPFHAYFATGSATEFSVTPSHGLAVPGTPELPVEISFSPKTYGKLLKGMFVVDMIDAQYIYDVVGKMPDYVPPVVAQSSLAPIVAPIDSPASKRKGAGTKIKRPYINSRK